MLQWLRAPATAPPREKHRPRKPWYALWSHETPAFARTGTLRPFGL